MSVGETMVKTANIEVRSLNVTAIKTNVSLEVPLVSSPLNVVLTHLANHILRVIFLLLHVQ